MMNDKEQSRQMSRAIARCWTDTAYKERLMNDPVPALNEEGMTLPAGLTVKVVENTGTLFHLVIPTRQVELSDASLDQVAGGVRVNSQVTDAVTQCNVKNLG